MTRHLMFGLATALALAGCGGGASNQQAAGANAASDNGTPITLVGCLVPGAAGSQSSAVGTSGNTAANGFTLIDVTTTSNPSSATGPAPGAPGAPAATGTSGTPAPPGTPRNPTVDTGTPRTYSLIAGKKQDDLQKYLNSRVEVAGIAVASTDTGAGVPDAGAASTPPGTPSTDVPRVRVNQVRQLEKSCK